MPLGDNSGGAKIIDIKPVKEKREKNQFVSAAKWCVFVLWLVVVTALAWKYHANNDSLQGMFSKPLTVVVPQQQVAPVLSSPKVEEVKPAAAEVATMPKEASPEIAALAERMDKLETQNQNLLNYFAARDLKDSINDADNFNEELKFLQSALGRDADVSGKLDILQQATANGMVTREKLVADLKSLDAELAKNADNSFSGQIKNALGNLVKVSKIEPDANAAASDYDSIIKRAEITLAREKLSAGELQNTINEVAKLGKPAEEFVREANNLERVLEVTDFLVIYTKTKATAE